jgi:hypothetical protein
LPYTFRINPSVLDESYRHNIVCPYIYREVFYLVDRFDGSALHGNRGVACREAQTNFADESACLTADNVRNEVVIIHRSQEVLKMLSLYA